MTATPEATIREIVGTDYRTAAVFQRFGLDFCCGGCRTIGEACRDARVDETAVLRELDTVLRTQPAGVPRYDTWDARRLIAHIVDVHHDYVRRALPVLIQHTSKIAEVHAARHPELPHVADLFRRVAAEMTEHMAKEEQVLFPFVAALEDARTSGAPAPVPPFGTVGSPIAVMEAEHRFVGDAMAEMRHLTGDFVPPEDACATYRVCLEELDAFERDLHDHVHLENNVLFPKAIALESGSRS